MFQEFSWKATDPEFEKRWKEIFRTKNIPKRSTFSNPPSKYLDSAGAQDYQISNNIFVVQDYSFPKQNIDATINGESINNLTLNCKKHEKTGAYPFFDIGYEFLVDCYEKKQNVAITLNCTTSPVLTAFLMRFCNITFAEASRHLIVCLKDFRLSYQDIAQLQYYQIELSISD